MKMKTQKEFFYKKSHERSENPDSICSFIDKSNCGVPSKFLFLENNFNSHEMVDLFIEQILVTTILKSSR